MNCFCNYSYFVHPGCVLLMTMHNPRLFGPLIVFWKKKTKVRRKIPSELRYKRRKWAQFAWHLLQGNCGIFLEHKARVNHINPRKLWDCYWWWKWTCTIVFVHIQWTCTIAINKFNELISRLLNAGENVKDEE